MSNAPEGVVYDSFDPDSRADRAFGSSGPVLIAGNTGPDRLLARNGRVPNLVVSSGAFKFANFNLSVSGIDRVDANGAAPEVSAAMKMLLQDANVWGLL